MDKTKTLKRRKKPSVNTPKFRLKKGVKLSKHDPLKTLLNEELVAQAFWECLKDNDSDGAMEIIFAHFKALNISCLSKEADIPRSTIYHSLREKNPTIKTVAKLIHCCA